MTKQSANLSYPEAGSLLNMMSVPDSRRALDAAIAKPETDYPAIRGIMVRYIDRDPREVGYFVIQIG